MIDRVLRSKSSFSVLIVLAIFAVAACTRSGKLTTSGSSETGDTVTVKILKVYPTNSGSSWMPVLSEGRFFVKGLKLTLEGTCSRGVAYVKVEEIGVTASDPITCGGDGTFVYAITFANSAEGNKTIQVTGYGVDNEAIAGASDSSLVRIDNSPPTAPTIVTPAVSPHVFNSDAAFDSGSGIFTVSGTVTSDTARLTGPNGTQIELVGTSWTYEVALIQNSSQSLNFYAYDLAGNQSSATTQALAWNPAVELLVSGPFIGESLFDTSNTFILETSVQNAEATTMDGEAINHLESGFNYMTKSLRGL